jgi:thiol-disulfide isomerase/thioredoxin
MRKARVGAALLAGSLLLWGGMALAAPSVETILKWRPRQEGVLYSTPTDKEIAGCKVEPVTGKGKGAGWLLRDPQGRPLRRFYDTQYDGQTRTNIDVWSYYHEGVESYREIHVNTREEPDQMHFRWLNAGGMKWGVAYNKDNKIDAWKAISPEEVSQEILQALIKKDFARLQALLITDAELKMLGLPPEQVRHILNLRRGAEAKFQATLSRLSGVNEQSRWLHLEVGAPQCLPADQTGARGDIVRFSRGTVLCETSGKSDWFQTGEIVQIGPATWRIIDAPTPGHEGSGNNTLAENPEVQKLLKELGELDAEWSRKQNTQPTPADVVRYNLARTAVLEKMLPLVKAEDREQWLRQQADCLSAAAQSSPPDDRRVYLQLRELVAQLEKTAQPGSSLLAYVTYREMQADYSYRINNIGKGGDFAKVQQEWLERLAKFIKTYPAAEDSPDALLQLGWVSEMVGKEIEAKNWYQQLVRDFPGAAQANKAAGSIRRLELDNNVLALSSTTLAGTAFDVASLRGKAVVVYYWASWNGQSVGDFAKLKLLLDSYGSKGLELVTVNLDTSAEEAVSFVKKTSAPGIHLHETGGMESKLATYYGVQMLPNLFLVNKEGKVVNRVVQVSNLEDELKKLLK